MSREQRRRVSLGAVALVALLALVFVGWDSRSQDESVTLPELIEWFRAQQETVLPIAPPTGMPFGQRGTPPALPFRRADWPKDVLALLPGIVEYGCPAYPVTLIEDQATRSVVLLNMDGVPIHVSAASTDYDPHAFADAKAESLGVVSQSGVESLRELHDPSRVQVTVTLVPEDFYSNYVAGEAAAAYDALVLPSMESMMMPMGAGAIVFAVTDVELVNGEPVVTWPGQVGYYYVVETCVDLEGGDWVAVALSDGVASDMTWTDTSGDGFGLVRVREVPNGSPVDSDGDGLDDLAEQAVGYDPIDPDMDDDGLLDGWEDTYGLDPHDDGTTDVANGADGDPDGDGIPNSAEQYLGTNPNVADDAEVLGPGDVSLYYKMIRATRNKYGAFESFQQPPTGDKAYYKKSDYLLEDVCDPCSSGDTVYHATKQSVLQPFECQTIWSGETTEFFICALSPLGPNDIKGYWKTWTGVRVGGIGLYTNHWVTCDGSYPYIFSDVDDGYEYVKTHNWSNATSPSGSLDQHYLEEYLINGPHKYRERTDLSDIYTREELRSVAAAGITKADEFIDDALWGRWVYADCGGVLTTNDFNGQTKRALTDFTDRGSALALQQLHYSLSAPIESVEGLVYKISVAHLWEDEMQPGEVAIEAVEVYYAVGNGDWIHFDEPDRMKLKPPSADGQRWPVAVQVESPEGDEPDSSNTMVWKPEGLSSAKFQFLPDPPEFDVLWGISGFPDTPETVVEWTPHDPTTGDLGIGYGGSPVLEVQYVDPSGVYDDYLPPDSSWFGPRTVTTTSGVFVETRPMWAYFDVTRTRPRRSDGLNVAAWYHYWVQGAVPALVGFEYVEDLGPGVYAEHHWTVADGDVFQIDFSAMYGTNRPVFDTVAGTYTEVPYPEYSGEGIHGVAKICEHERWHSILEREVRSVILGGLGHHDADKDGLSDTRELEIGTDPNNNTDTCNLASYTDGGANYSTYASYADEELFCRWKMEGHLGNEALDWSFPGMQAYRKPGD